MYLLLPPCYRCGSVAWCGVEWSRSGRKHYAVCGGCDPIVRALEISTKELGIG